jgi:hypothetical protein
MCKTIAFQLFELKEETTNIDRVYYICAAVSLFITLIVVVSFVAITRLLVFHIKLGKCVCVCGCVISLSS